MHCTGMKQFLPDLASGVQPVSGETEQHLRQCPSCAAELNSLRATLALLEHWEAPDPSPYFDTRLFASLREEKARAAPRAWLGWIRKPALAVALTLLVVTGVSLYNSQRGLNNTVVIAAEPGTPVGDLNALDRNHDLLTDFDVLDDLQVQHDVTP
jgi:predicted anti-sigma-YlaC factor YlaD